MIINVVGIGKFTEEDLQDGKIRIKKYVPRKLSRSMLKLSKMFYISSIRAIQDSGLENMDNTAVIASTNFGEIDGNIDFFSQINESNGVFVSPKVFQSTVTNAPASIMSIGMNIKSPVITVVHSFLSIEAAISYAKVLFKSSSCENILIAGGDIFLDSWEEKLKEKGREDLAETSRRLDFKEGAVSIILSRDKDKQKSYFEIINCEVIHLSNNKRLSTDILTKYGFSINESTNLIIKSYCNDNLSDFDELSKNLNIKKENIKLSSNSLANPLNDITNLVKEGNTKKDILFIGSEYNDYGILQIKIN